MRPLLEGKNIKKAYGRQVVLDDLSFIVSEGMKVALVGRNGAGKSTLLNILNGREEADSGEVSILPWTRVGVVHQHEILPDTPATELWLEKQSEKAVWDVRKLASQFGLTTDHLALPPGKLSGGYQMRVKIVAMLLQDPNLLLLDEPVNYLDLQTLLLLEKWLANYKGSFIITAHDREFLQNTCTHTFEIERGNLTDYDGPVEEYFAWKEEQKEYQRKSNKKLAKEIAHHQAFVDRFRFKASQASRAQSKIKHIAKLRRNVTQIAGDLATTQIVIPTPVIIPGNALRIEKLEIGYQDKIIASDISLSFNRGQKVVIAGENGKGKSTLLKTIAGIIPARSGSYKWYHRADIGYYDQKTDATLISGETVLQYLTRMAPEQTSGERILMMAGNFLFKNDDLEKSTSVLSGGERARLCLAGILLHEHSVLILDEPTNHLDMETAESLASALKEYGGTVVFVSHARTFVNELADTIYEIRGGTIRHYTGTYEEYVSDVAAITLEESDDSEQKPDKLSATAYAERKALIKEKERALLRLQKQVDELDKEKSAILAFFFENPTDYSPEKSRRLDELNDELPRLEERWLALHQEIDTLKNV